MARISDFDFFCKKFKPLSEEESLVEDDYDKAFYFAKEKGFEYVWTVIEGDKNWYLCPGYHIVNRMGYVLTSVPWKEGQRDLKY
jgi:hypothetical protein